MVLIRLAKCVTAGFLAVFPLAVLPPDAVAHPNDRRHKLPVPGSGAVEQAPLGGQEDVSAPREGQ
jgi:hypothetical protein